MTHPSNGLQNLFLTDKDLAARWSVHRLTPWGWVKAGKLPKPIKINGATRWKLADIEAGEAKQEAME